MKRLTFLAFAFLAARAFGAGQNVTVLPNGTGTGTFNTPGITYYLAGPAGGTWDFSQVTVVGAGGGGGGGGPGGTPNQVQYNSAGAFGGLPLAYSGGSLIGTSPLTRILLEGAGPSFQVGATGNGGNQGIYLSNNSTGSSALEEEWLQNSTDEIRFGITGTGFSGAFLTNGPSGEAAYFTTSSTVPISIGVNESAAMNISASNVVTFVNPPVGVTAGAGGSNTQVQYNMGGALQGAPSLTWVSPTLGNTTSSNGGQQYYAAQNTSTGTSAFAEWTLSNSAHSFNVVLTGTNYSGSFLSGGPSGESTSLSFTGTSAIAFGLNGNYAGQITTGGWTDPGVLNVTGAVTLSTKLAVAQGGTGSSTALGAALALTPATYPGGATGATQTINWANGLVQTYTLGANTTFSFSGAQSGQTIIVEVIQAAGGGDTVTWPADPSVMMWTGGTPPTMTSTASHRDVYTIFYDGSLYLASYVQNLY